MNGSNQTEKTEKRKRPPVGARGRFKKQNPRRTNNEEFVIPILGPFATCDVAGGLATKERWSCGGGWSWFLPDKRPHGATHYFEYFLVFFTGFVAFACAQVATRATATFRHYRRRWS